MRIEYADLEHYRHRLETLLHVAVEDPEYSVSEARWLAELILLQIVPALDLQALENELAAATDNDLAALEAAVAQLEPQELPELRLPGLTIDPRQAMNELSEALSLLRAKQRTLDPISAALEIESADSRVTDLLVCAIATERKLAALEEVGEAKLKHFSELDLARLWASVQREFEPRGLGAPFDREAVPAGFLNLDAPAKLQRKLAQYIVSLKPALILARLNRGLFRDPRESMGPARLLLLNSVVVPLESDPVRLDLVRSLGRLSALWRQLMRGSATDLVRLLRLPLESHLVGGSHFHAASSCFAKVPVGRSGVVAVHELLGLLTAIQNLEGSRAPVVQALLHYKLGLEVGLPESRAEVDAPERTLQKRLCRWLLAKGLYAEGTKFGCFESDFLVTVGALATILEVKVYKRNAPTESSLRANLAQLQDYMDKRPVRPRGVLVLYNLSSLLLIEPKRWIRGRYWIVCVNLGDATGSRRRGTLVLEEGTGDQLLVFSRA